MRPALFAGVLALMSATGRFITGADGQAILAKHGFGPGDPSK